MSAVRVGLIGPGDIGGYLGQLCRELPGVQLAAVTCRQEAKRAEVEARFGVPVYAHHGAMLAHSALDAVIVATPSDTHAAIALEAIGKGLHVFCEKPMALSVRDCDGMIAAARRQGVRLMVGQVLREMPLFVKVREILGSGVLGKPLMVVLQRAEMLALWGWYLDKARMRSVFHEMVVHEFDLLRCLVGEVREMEVASIRRAGHDLDFDTPTLTRVAFEGGASGMLIHHWSSPLTIGRGTLVCEKGTLLYDWRAHNCIEYAAAGGEKVSLEVPETPESDGYRRELGSFFNWITSGTPPLITAEDGRAAVVLAEMALLSRQSGKPVHCLGGSKR